MRDVFANGLSRILKHETFLYITNPKKEKNEVQKLILVFLFKLSDMEFSLRNWLPGWPPAIS